MPIHKEKVNQTIALERSSEPLREIDVDESIPPEFLANFGESHKEMFTDKENLLKLLSEEDEQLDQKLKYDLVDLEILDSHNTELETTVAKNKLEFQNVTNEIRSTRYQFQESDRNIISQNLKISGNSQKIISLQKQVAVVDDKLEKLENEIFPPTITQLDLNNLIEKQLILDDKITRKKQEIENFEKQSNAQLNSEQSKHDAIFKQLAWDKKRTTLREEFESTNLQLKEKTLELDEILQKNALIRKRISKFEPIWTRWGNQKSITKLFMKTIKYL
jgi:hypothetical protein